MIMSNMDLNLTMHFCNLSLIALPKAYNYGNEHRTYALGGGGGGRFHVARAMARARARG